MGNKDDFNKAFNEPPEVIIDICDGILVVIRKQLGVKLIIDQWSTDNAEEATAIIIEANEEV